MFEQIMKEKYDVKGIKDRSKSSESMHAEKKDNFGKRF